MTTRLLWALVIPCALAATACPTRVVTAVDAGRDTPAAGGGRGGSAGASGNHSGGQGGVHITGAGGSTGGSVGGMAGSSTTQGDRGGSGGFAGSNAPIAGASGSAGTPGTGGVAGQTGSGGGVAGGGGSLSAGGAAGGTTSDRAPGFVVCDAVTNCPLANGGQCCYSPMDGSSACQGAGATCEPVPGAQLGTYYVKTKINCDSSSDCSGGEVCCLSEFYISRSTACMTASSCVDVPGAGPGGYTTYRRQVCDPRLVAPTDCLIGSCKTAVTFRQDAPPYLYLCL